MEKLIELLNKSIHYSERLAEVTLNDSEAVQARFFANECRVIVLKLQGKVLHEP